MRRFVVFAHCRCARSDGAEVIVELPDGTPDDECDSACSDMLETLIGNEFDTGWNELMPDGTEK